MEKNFFKLFLIAFLLFYNVGCCCLKKQPTYVNAGSTMVATSRLYNQIQLDSLCVADTLATELDSWIISSYSDYETGKRATKYTFIKHPNTINEITYIVTKRDSVYYNVTKRYIIQ